MNTSFEDQASQSTNDRHSEGSSVNPPSPRSSSAPFVPGSHQSNQFSAQHYHHQTSPATNQQQRPNQESVFNFNHYMGTSGYRSNELQRQPNQQQQQFQQPNIPTVLPIRRPYSGVDKLLIAAMVEDSAAVAAAMAASGNSGQYMPSGRGLAYFGNTRDTSVQLPTPSNKCELELYCLLERANLLSYFGTFLNFGGDDVQQLIEADEDEFLEIMSLVGMNQKPLHVRRLQKALIEWRENRESESNYRKSQPTGGYSINTNRPPVNRSLATEMSPRNTESRATTAPDNESHNQQYNYPYHNVLVGAPKRLRLMDDLNRRAPIPEPSQTSRLDSEDGNTPQQPDKSKSSTLVDNRLSERPLTSSPRSPTSADRDDDNIIDVLDSPKSYDLGSEIDAARVPCESPPDLSSGFRHSKFGRYRALLQGSPNKSK